MPNKLNPASVLADKKVVNNAGGLVYEVDKWKRLERYLIIGSEGGTFYVTPRKNVELSNQNIIACLKEDPLKTVNMAVDISDRALAPKNDQALFVLAVALALGDDRAKRLAEINLTKVARTASHLTMFIDFVTSLRGWGKVLRRTAANWYRDIGRTDLFARSSAEQEEKNLSALVYQLMKYANRNGYTQRDILRLCHVKAEYDNQNTLFKWITNPSNIPEFPSFDDENALLEVSEELYKYAAAKQLAKYDKKRMIDLIIKYRLPHEVIPTEAKNDPDVWQALLDAGMPLNALIRNLNKLTELNLLRPFSENFKKVKATLTNPEYIHKSRLHPINILNQMKGYSRGYSQSGMRWSPVSEIKEALEDAFYLAFPNVAPTGKNIMLAIDVSGSMTCAGIAGMNLMASEIVAAMAMVTLRTEENCIIRAFSDRFIDPGITAKMDLNQVLDKTASMSFGGTDCCLPMRYATDNKLDVDMFNIYTDNETWYGYSRRNTPSEELRHYRKVMDKPTAKLVTIATSTTDFTIADPNDAGTLDVVGFSPAVPQILSYFATA